LIVAFGLVRLERATETPPPPCPIFYGSDVANMIDMMGGTFLPGVQQRFGFTRPSFLAHLRGLSAGACVVLPENRPMREQRARKCAQG